MAAMADADSEAGERDFKEMVAAVTWMRPEARRCYLVGPRDRFLPAVGGGVIHMQLQLAAF